MDPVVLVAVRSLPTLGIRAGDRVVFDPVASPLPSLCRDIPNVGAVLGAFEAGDLVTLTRPVCPADLRLAVASGGRLSEPPSPSELSRPGYLHLVP